MMQSNAINTTDSSVDKHHPHRVVIVGGGAGGLELATRLGQKYGRSKNAEVILIDANLSHIWKPLLHEVAAGTLDAESNHVAYYDHSLKNHYQFFLGRFKALNRQEKCITLDKLLDENQKVLADERTITYDTLVLSIGSVCNDFGTPGAKEHCIFLDCTHAAEHFHTLLRNRYIKAQADELNHISTNDEQFQIAIIGAGATGVELAAEIHLAKHQMLAYGFNSLSPENIGITIVEGAADILSGQPDYIIKHTRNKLNEFGVKVMTNTSAEAIEADAIVCKGGVRVPANIMVWAAGVKAPDFLKELEGLETNRNNQLVVRPTLLTTHDDNIYAFGDCSSYTPEGAKRPVPPRAEVANQQARMLANSISAKINGETLPIFEFNDKGTFVSLGANNTVGNVFGSVNMRGFTASLMYAMLYRMHQQVIYGSFITCLIIGKDWLTRTFRMRLKLH